LAFALSFSFLFNQVIKRYPLNFYIGVSVIRGSIFVRISAIGSRRRAAGGRSGCPMRRRRSGGWTRYNKGRLKVVFQMTSMLTSDEVVKEQIFQTISKNVLRSSKNQKLLACIPHTPHFRIRGFMRATACCVGIRSFIHVTVCCLL